LLANGRVEGGRGGGARERRAERCGGARERCGAAGLRETGGRDYGAAGTEFGPAGFRPKQNRTIGEKQASKHLAILEDASVNPQRMIGIGPSLCSSW